MKKTALVTLALVLSSIALLGSGCRAEGEIDPHGATSVVAPR